MHAPFSRHLAQFSRIPPVGASAAPPVAETASRASEPSVTLTVAALQAQLDAARQALREDLDVEHAAARQLAESEHAAAMSVALAEAAARRDTEEGASVATQLAEARQALQDDLAEQIATTMRPLLVEAVATRTIAALVDTVARVLADPDHPVLTISGPASRLAAIEAALGEGGVTYKATESDELSVTANGIRMETRFAAALAALDAAPHGGA